MIAAILLALTAVVLTAVCIRQHRELEDVRARQEDAESFRQDAAVLRGENARWRRENAVLHRALQNEQAHSDDLERSIALRMLNAGQIRPTPAALRPSEPCLRQECAPTCSRAS